ncbi:MAG: DUF3604 domain-containing protein [Halieaceae bacterium]|jgi:hypothetical protein|nr:DUF3604 domain-containing protein [Halieaceae bacterium]
MGSRAGRGGIFLALTGWLLALSSVSQAADGAYPDRLLWGDTHVHTFYSLDALLYNNDSIGPDKAYRFARGETVVSSSGQPAQLTRPLDFLVVSDHAEYLGVTWQLLNPEPDSPAGDAARNIMAALRSTFGAAARSTHSRHFFEFSSKARQALAESPETAMASWREIARAADAFNEPGEFSAFIGFEWTSNPAGDNLHRVVVLADGAERALRQLPMSALHSEDPQALWDWLARYERETGGTALAIPHNGNLSNGRMFALENFRGERFTADYAARRARWEPLYEVTQMKGDAETHPILSPTDEYASFERWDDSNVFFTAAKQPSMLPFEYARSTLKHGLLLQQELGVNPFRFGLIGSTDTHTGLATASEKDFFNKISLDEPAPGRASHRMSEKGAYGAVVSRRSATISASGYTGVWSRENTREAIMAALKRREVYATTGPRIGVRLFAGWDFTAADVRAIDREAIAYAGGVPMGGTLRGSAAADPDTETGRAPTLMFYASRDPDEVGLDRLQIVKGWLDADGVPQEKIYDVASAAEQGAGANTLAAVWRDPDFSPAEVAFYYGRVLQRPSPRWTTRDAKRYGTALPDGVPGAIQERAYTSPIWYQP